MKKYEQNLKIKDGDYFAVLNRAVVNQICSYARDIQA